MRHESQAIEREQLKHADAAYSHITMALSRLNQMETEPVDGITGELDDLRERLFSWCNATGAKLGLHPIE